METVTICPSATPLILTMFGFVLIGLIGTMFWLWRKAAILARDVVALQLLASERKPLSEWHAFVDLRTIVRDDYIKRHYKTEAAAHRRFLDLHCSETSMHPLVRSIQVWNDKDRADYAEYNRLKTLGFKVEASE